jgi:hypothetical protein
VVEYLSSMYKGLGSILALRKKEIIHPGTGLRAMPGTHLYYRILSSS